MPFKLSRNVIIRASCMYIVYIHTHSNSVYVKVIHIYKASTYPTSLVNLEITSPQVQAIIYMSVPANQYTQVMYIQVSIHMNSICSNSYQLVSDFAMIVTTSLLAFSAFCFFAIAPPHDHSWYTLHPKHSRPILLVSHNMISQM